MFEYEFFRNAFVGVLLVASAAAVIGTYIVSRRLVAISGGITHACFGGLGLGYFLGWNPVAMAAAFAVASSLGVDYMARRRNVREDSAIAVVWALGMALGVLFVFLTPGYVPELNAFLFGNILTVTRTDLWLFAAFAFVVAVVFGLFYRPIVLCAFDRDFARVRGVPVAVVNTMMTVLVALCIVLTIRLVGVMLLMSMLALPQMISELFCRRFGTLLFSSVFLSVGCCVGGLFLATVIDVPCSALMVLVMLAVYILTSLGCKIISSKTIIRKNRGYLQDT